MTNRDWTLVVLLISLIQTFIWYAAFVNAGNGSALNYVSFAGTLISIILAVLAIGYTYGESVSQKSKGDTLATQISALSDVTRGIKIQAESLDEVFVIKSELSEIARRIEEGLMETREKVSGMSNSLDSVRETMEGINYLRKAPITTSQINKNEAAQSLMAARTPLMEISILIILTMKGKTVRSYEIRETIDEYVTRAQKKGEVAINTSASEVAELFTGAVHALIPVLQGFGLIMIKDDIMKIEPALMEEVQKTSILNPMRAGEFYISLREEVLSNLEYPT